jgi:uncharacterized protein
MFFYAAVLPGFRVLMVWVYDRTKSLLVAILMHASLTGSTVVVLSTQATGMPLIAYYLALASGLWVVVGLIHAVDLGQLRHWARRR